MRDLKMNKRILVTGGAGFIGSHLCNKLLNDGNEVICVDNYFTGNKNNIIHLLENPYFELIRHDITFPLYLEIDEIYNLACPASPKYYQFDPIQTIKTSVLGSINLLGLAKRLKIKILQASTSEIYGNPKEYPQTEAYWGNVNPIGIRACYDEGKRCAETIFYNYYRALNLPIKIVRIFNTYGTKMQIDDGRVISNFIIQALKNQDLTIYGDGQQIRCFCYVDDLIEGLIKMMENDIVGPVNLGNPYEEITILDLAKTIIELTDSKSKIIFKELPEDDPIKRKPDISLAMNKLKWNPKITLQKGLMETITYFKGLL